MSAGDPFAEWRACGHVRQADMDRLRAAGVPTMAMAEGPDGVGHALARDRVVPHGRAHRFEFARHDRVAGEAVPAVIVLALDEGGAPADLVAFRGEPAPFVGTWLGRVGLLGEEQLWRARDALQIYVTPLDWLRAGREGVCVVDPARAAPMLREAGTLEVGSQAERRRLLALMAVRLPDVRVRPAEREIAA